MKKFVDMGDTIPSNIVAIKAFMNVNSYLKNGNTVEIAILCLLQDDYLQMHIFNHIFSK